MNIDTSNRFSSKAGKYAEYRPNYASEAIRAISVNAKLIPESVIADIGSGTGIVSRHIIENRNLVYAVEPNPAMRQIAERNLGRYPNFHSVEGNSEATTLPNGSIDLITVGQAIRWFDGEPTQQEFLRILKPNGRLAILQNSRPNDDLISELDLTYTAENGWTSSAEYTHIIRPFDWWFGGENQFLYLRFANSHTFDLESLVGWELSNSHAPDENHAAFDDFVNAIVRVFERFQINGRVAIHFITHLYMGKIQASDEET